MRVVLDTNVLISALITPEGRADALYRAWRDGRFVLVTSEAQLDEFRRVSRYPKLHAFFPPAAAGTMLNELRLLAHVVAKLPKVAVSRDPADDMLLATAQGGRVDYLVSGDKGGLLALGRHKSTRIVSVSEMLGLFVP